MASEPTNPQNLHEAIFQKLRSLLVEGKIAPGSKLNERELAESLNVSRTPIREAIRRLAAEGLVELIANRGAIAVELSLEDVIHTFDVIADLEGFSGELAATHISDATLSELEALQYEMMASYARRDLSSYYKLNLRIHHLINQAANNPVLAQLFSQVNARIEALRFRSNQDGVKWERAVEEHQEMLDEDARRRLYSNPLRILDTKNPAMQALVEGAPKLMDHLGEASRLHFDTVCAILREQGVAYRINPRLVRGMDYYNLTVFEFITDQLGSQGTVCGGGRYDYLLEQVGGKPSPAVGWALGVERVLELVRVAGLAPQAPVPDAYAIIPQASALPRCIA